MLIKILPHDRHSDMRFEIVAQSQQILVNNNHVDFCNRDDVPYAELYEPIRVLINVCVTLMYSNKLVTELEDLTLIIQKKDGFIIISSDNFSFCVNKDVNNQDMLEKILNCLKVEQRSHQKITFEKRVKNRKRLSLY
jgi:Zn-finger protein